MFYVTADTLWVQVVLPILLVLTAVAVCVISRTREARRMRVRPVHNMEQEEP